MPGSILTLGVVVALTSLDAVQMPECPFSSAFHLTEGAQPNVPCNTIFSQSGALQSPGHFSRRRQYRCHIC